MEFGSDITIAIEAFRTNLLKDMTNIKKSKVLPRVCTTLANVGNERFVFNTFAGIPLSN